MRQFLMILPVVCLLAACAGEGAGVAKTPDGDKVYLNISQKGWVTADTTAGKLTGYNQNDSFYGAWVDDSRQRIQLSYQGSEADNIPKTGTATYHGYVVRVNADGEVYNAGKSRLNVDFGNKVVNGKLEMSGMARDITLEKGNLNGAKFSGQATMLLNQGTYSGGLMGDGATEAAGVVEFNNSNLNAAFGGKRY